MAQPLPIVVPAIPPRPPQVTLIGSSVTAGSGADPSGAVWELGDEQFELLPADLQDELKARQGDSWIRGFTWAPESHAAASIRDACDFTSIDLPALPAPAGLAGVPTVGTGTLAANTYHYQVTAVNVNGETTPCALIAVVLSATGEITLTWDYEGDATYFNVYGRVTGSIGKLASVAAGVTTYVDSSATSVGAAPPSSNTTGGPGNYVNPAIQTFVPYLVVAEDWCSTWGWSERDYIGRASRLLENAKYAAVEREFWTGALAQVAGYPNAYLSNASIATDLTPGSVPSMTRGLQILQDAIMSCGFGGQGMIHVTAETAPNLLGARRVGPLYLDVFDNIVVPGSGYPVTGIGGAAPGTGYAYMAATDLVAYREEAEPQVYPDNFAQAIDWGQAGEPNTLRFRAMKYAATQWDAQCAFFCKVALSS